MRKRRNWEDNIKINLTETEINMVDLIQLNITALLPVNMDIYTIWRMHLLESEYFEVWDENN
jgi:hypothetical protein